MQYSLKQLFLFSENLTTDNSFKNFSEVETGKS